MVRRDDARAATLRDRGVEVFVGNLHDWRDLRRAVEGVQRAYHCPPFDPNGLHSSALMALAAQDAGLEVVALMSGWNPHPSHPSIHQREQWIANNLYRRLPVDVIHINPGLFAFTYLLGLPMIHHFGMLAGPWGEGLNAPPSNEDIGAVAACALMNPAPYIGRCLRPTGPSLISPTDVAAILTDVVGRRVTYREVPRSMLLKAATAQGFDMFQIAQVRHYAEELRRGAYGQPPTGHVEEVVGRPAESFRSIARRYVAEPDLIHPGLRTGSLLSALSLMVRTVFARTPDADRWERGRSYPAHRPWSAGPRASRVGSGRRSDFAFIVADAEARLSAQRLGVDRISRRLEPPRRHEDECIDVGQDRGARSK